jgi:hypothetical protein
VLRHDKRRNSADALRYLRRTTANRAIGGYRLVNDREISRRGLQPALIASARDVGARMRFTPESTQLSWFRRSRRNSVSARRRSQVSRIAFSQRRCDSRLSGWAARSPDRSAPRVRRGLSRGSPAVAPSRIPRLRRISGLGISVSKPPPANRVFAGDVVAYVSAIRTTYLREAGIEPENRNITAKRDVNYIVRTARNRALPSATRP